MVENVKPTKRKRTPVILALLVILCLIAVTVWALFFRDTAYLTDSTAHVDGTITVGDDAVTAAANMLPSAYPAAVVADQTAETARVGLVFVGLTEEADTNKAVLNLAKKEDLKASFALSAAEALEYTDFLADLRADGFDLLSNGAAGESNLQAMDASAMVSSMLKSRQALENAANTAVPLLYCSSTTLTGDVLRAAKVSGYDAVLAPQTTHVLDETSFAEEGDAYRFVSTLQGDTIVVVDLRGNVEAIQDEESVTAEKPAVDKMPDLDDSTPETAAEPVPILVQVQWLIKAMAAQELTTDYVSNFTRTDGLQTLQQDAADPLAELAVVYHSCLTTKNQAGLGIAALPAAADMDTTLADLAETKARATFFVTPQDLDARAEDLQRLSDAGATLGLAFPAEEINGLSASELFDRLYTASRTLSGYAGGSSLLLADADYTASTLENLRAAAKVMNLRVVWPDSPDQMQAGALYLLPAFAKTEVVDLQARAAAANLQLVDLSTAIANAGSIASLTPDEISTLRKDNAGQRVEAQQMVYTTERAVSFVFYGMSHTSAVFDAVDTLQAHGAKGTFFVSLNELMNSSRAIEHILATGNELGIYYKPGTDYPQDYVSVLNYLHSWKTYAAWRYGADAAVVLMPGDTAQEPAEEAISSMGCRLIRNTFSVIRSGDADLTPADADQAMEHIDSLRVMRGAFASFNMSFYTYDADADRGNTVLGAVLDAFFTQHIDTLAYREPLTDTIEDASRFTVTTATALLDSDAQYTFCEAPQTDIALDKNVLTDLPTDEDRFAYIAQRYYGNVDVCAQNKLPGFTQQQINQLNKSGRFTDDPVIFLTFDDWGTEQSINELLYVLDKHNIKATFFVRTGYVDDNPNLLRTIAVHGHQIASHTDQHMPLSDALDAAENNMTSLTEEEAATLRQDLVTSYDKLYRYTGDVVVDGRPALTPMFRPPTLAVSKIGLEQVFDVGFQYSISGGYSTGDYAATSYQNMLNRLTSRPYGDNQYMSVGNGTVIVMHMQENAKYTAQALDTMIPVWQSEGYSFARIDDYLGK